MEGTNINFPDDNISHDHTYYGNGCPNDWGTSGDGGSTVACLTRIEKTYDNEDQQIGPYYAYQAATSGSGGTITVENANAPDTFCPLGWQLPYSGTGGDYYNVSKSWNFLFSAYSIPTGDTVPAAEVNKIKSYPFSLIYSGTYHWAYGRLYKMSGIGRIASPTYNGWGYYFLEYWSERIKPSSSGGFVNGVSIRCNY